MNHVDGLNYGVRPVTSILGYRSTVGRLTLDQLIGVRIPAPQPYEMVYKASSSTLLHLKECCFLSIFVFTSQLTMQFLI
jgi:hypothetical protein